MHPLPDQYTRCNGENCAMKEQCARYLSIALDTHEYPRWCPPIEHQMCSLLKNEPYAYRIDSVGSLHEG